VKYTTLVCRETRTRTRVSGLSGVRTGTFAGEPATIVGKYVVMQRLCNEHGRVVPLL